MILTRNEWLEMLAAIKRLDNYLYGCQDSKIRTERYKDLDMIKDKIQSVIGQVK